MDACSSWAVSRGCSVRLSLADPRRADLSLLTRRVPMLLPVPEGVSGLLLRLLTMPPLIYSSFTLLRPSSFPPELASLPADLVLLPPVLAALLVWYTNGDLLSQRTWGWTVPAAVVGLKREVEGGLKQGVESAARMRELVYSSPTA